MKRSDRWPYLPIHARINPLFGLNSLVSCLCFVVQLDDGMEALFFFEEGIGEAQDVESMLRSMSLMSLIHGVRRRNVCAMHRVFPLGFLPYWRCRGFDVRCRGLGALRIEAHDLWLVVIVERRFCCGDLPARSFILGEHYLVLRHGAALDRIAKTHGSYLYLLATAIWLLEQGIGVHVIAERAKSGNTLRPINLAIAVE